MRTLQFLGAFFRSHRATVLTLAVLLAAIAMEQSVAQEASPDTIYHPAVDYPLFVSAQLAETRPASDPTLFEAIGAERIGRIFEATPVHGCYPVEPILSDYFGGRSAPTSLAEAARSYPLIALGIVKELTPGFNVGEPGTLVRAEAEAASRQIMAGEVFYVFVPHANFIFRGKRICKEDARYIRLPKVGDEILLFTDPAGTKAVDYFAVEYPQNLILIAGEEISYSSDLVKSMEDPEQLPVTKSELLTQLTQRHSGRAAGFCS